MHPDLADVRRRVPVAPRPRAPQEAALVQLLVFVSTLIGLGAYAAWLGLTCESTCVGVGVGVGGCVGVSVCL